MKLALAADAAGVDPRPRWVQPGAAIDLDFEAGRYWAGTGIAGPQALPGWTAGPPVIAGGGLVCDGTNAWRADLPGWAATDPGGVTVRADVTETPGATGVGYLFILHAGTLAERIALLTTRDALTTRVTRAGVETFTAGLAADTAARYRAVMAVRPGDAYVAATGAAAVQGAQADPPIVDGFEIGGFNATLPYRGLLHRLTIWRGRVANGLMDALV